MGLHGVTLSPLPMATALITREWLPIGLYPHGPPLISPLSPATDQMIDSLCHRSLCTITPGSRIY